MEFFRKWSPRIYSFVTKTSESNCDVNGELYPEIFTHPGGLITVYHNRKSVRTDCHCFALSYCFNPLIVVLEYVCACVKISCF